jgi:Na+/proline symporter
LAIIGAVGAALVVLFAIFVGTVMYRDERESGAGRRTALLRAGAAFGLLCAIFLLAALMGLVFGWLCPECETFP